MNFKEGIYYGEDEDNRISKVCLFESSTQDGWTTLAEYKSRMPEGQDAIYTIAGPDKKSVEKSPHLDALREKGFEVLYMTDPVDEWVMQRFTEFEGTPLKAIDKGEVDFDDDDTKKQREEKQAEFKDLLEKMQSILDEEVAEVRFSSRLKESPAVLVSGDNAMSPQVEALLRRQGQNVPKQKRILELNSDHALVGSLKVLFDRDADAGRLTDYTEVLFGQALLAEGSALPDPARFTQLVTELLVESASE